MSKVAPVTMYDSINPDSIPADAEVVAGYIDGDYAWSKDAWNRFPDAEKVLITVDGSLTANVADVERGDMTVYEAPGWIDAKQKAGHIAPTIYCDRSAMADIQYLCHGRSYYIWVADWTNTAHEVSGAALVQYMNDQQRNIDLSYVYNQEWLDRIDQANTPWPL